MGKQGFMRCRLKISFAWWRHQMETSSALLAISAGNSPVPGEIPAQRPVTRSFDIFFDLCLKKRLSKQSWGWWFETLWCSLWRQCNKTDILYCSDSQVTLIYEVNLTTIASDNGLSAVQRQAILKIIWLTLKFQWNIIQNVNIHSRCTCENVVCEPAAILHRD